MRSSLDFYATGMQRSILAVLGLNRTGNPPASARSGRRRLLIVALLLAAVLVWLVVDRWRQAGFDWKAFGASFVHINPFWLTLGGTMAVASYVVRALRWRVMLRPQRPHAGLWNLTRATMIGFTAVLLLGRPGEFVRPYLIARREEVSFSSQLAIWFLERIWDLLAVLLIFGFSLSNIGDSRARLGPRFEWILETGGYVVAGASLACLLVFLLLSRFAEPARLRLMEALRFLPDRHRERADGLIRAFLDGAASTRNGPSLFLQMSYTLLEWLVIVLSLAFVFWAYPSTAGFGFREVLIFVGFLAFGGLVQIPGIGGGFQIVAIVVLNELFKVPLEIATGMAITIWVISFVVVVPFGLGMAFHEGLTWRQIRALEVEAAEQAGGLEKPGGAA